MSYAIRKDGKGWRRVEIKSDCNDDEQYSELEPLPNKGIVVESEIIKLESAVTGRRLREAVLGIDNGWLNDIESKIRKLRKGLTA